MTQEEFKAAYGDLTKKENEIKEAKEFLQDSYLTEHLTVKPGDKVRVVTEDYFGGKQKDNIAYVSRCWVDSCGKINYSFIKAKKDGSVSCFLLRYYGKVNSIELLESAKQPTK